MKRLLLPLCTVVSTLAGWYFAQESRPSPVQANTSNAVVLTSPAEPEHRLNTGPDSLEILSTMERLLKEYPSPEQRYELVTHLYAELQDLDSSEFPSAIAAIASMNLEHSWAKHFAALVAGVWAGRDLPAARKWLLGLEKEEWFPGRTIFETWGRIDAVGMFDWLEAHAGEIKSEELRGIAVDITARTAGQTNPQRGLAALDALKPRDNEIYGYLNFFSAWAERDPAAAAARALQEPSDYRRMAATEYVFGAWAARDTAAARSWAERIPDPVLSRGALVAIGSGLALRDSREGADFLVSIPQDDSARAILHDVLESWKQKDLNAVLQWTAGLPDESLGLWALRETTKELSPEKIASAIANLPAEERDTLEERWRRIQKPSNSNAKID
ncbi:hypothetical protein ACXR0O_05400 [Verrucomicrobiota bacterium sgz303538]